MEKTQVTWADSQRIIVETPCGDDFLVGFNDDSLFRIEQQSAFKPSLDLGILFDHFYKGDSNVIWGAINQQMIIHYGQSIFFFRPYNKTQKNDERIRIGKRIKEIRQAIGWDAKTLANVTGFDAANICRIEAGKYSVGFDVLSKIASACGKKVDFVDLGDEDHGYSVTICPK